MKFQTFANHFQNLTEDGDGYLATCPAHPDGNPSLKITVTPERKALMTCRAGCSLSDVLKAADLTTSNLFDLTDVGTVATVSNSPASYEARDDAEAHLTQWAYALTIAPGEVTDALKRFGIDPATLTDVYAADMGIGYHDGRLWVAARTADKRLAFAQGRAFDPNTEPRWKGLPNPADSRWDGVGYVGRVDGQRDVVICEGMSDALTVAVLDRYDVIAVRGAQQAARVSEVAASLKGRTVFVAGDGDVAGQTMNRSVSDALKGTAAVVRAVPMPDGQDLNAIRQSDPDGFTEALTALLSNSAELTEEIVTVDDADDRFDAAYWDRIREELAPVGNDIMHANYAAFVADHCGNRLRFVEGIGWYRWSGKVWETAPDDSTSYQAITDAKQALAEYCAKNGGADWAIRAANNLLIHRHRSAIVTELRALRQLRCSADDMDDNKHLATFQNGTVNLRTGELKPHNPLDMLTGCARVNYVPGAKCPAWEKFLEDIFPGDPEKQRYLQTFLGYAITGEVREHALGVWYGHQGRNGKGTIIRTLESIFGSELILDVPFELFERSRNETHSEVIAQLRGARIIVAQEGSAEVPMNVARIKNWTGGDRIQARKLRQAVFTFMPRFTLIMATNYQPEFSAGGAALWARTKALHFDQTFAGREDRTLEPRLQGDEREGIAAWLVEGAVRYYQNGLQDIDAVREATEVHKDAVDPLKELLGEVFEYDEGGHVQRSAFNAKLKTWRDDNGDTAAKFTPASVKRNLLNNGVEEVRINRVWSFKGIRFVDDMPSAEAKARAEAIADGTLSVDLFGQDKAS